MSKFQLVWGDLSSRRSLRNLRPALAVSVIRAHTQALRYLERLVPSIVRKHYPENKGWKPLTGDLVGLITGLTRSDPRVEQFKSVQENEN